MKFITSAVALLILVLLATPAFARNVEQDALIPATFELTISGSVPEGESFGVEIAARGSLEPTVLYFCGPETQTACTGDGTTYTQTASFAAGTEVLYRFFRGYVLSPNFELIREGTETLDQATIINAAYEFGPAPGDTANVQFRLTVTGGPCPNATYYAVFGVPQGEFFSDQLTDPDGDGVYTLSRQLGRNPLYISIQQGIGSVQEPPSLYLLPGPPRSTIRDFGLVTPTQDMVFEASVTGCPADVPSTLPDTGAADRLPLVVMASSLLMLIAGGYLRRCSRRRA